MNKIKLIIEREYLSRIRKKSFIIMTFLGPVLMALSILIPVWLTTYEEEDDKLIAIIDKAQMYEEDFADTKSMRFDYLDSETSLDEVKQNFGKLGYYAVVEIPDTYVNPEAQIQIFSDKQPNLSVKLHVQNIVEQKLEAMRMVEEGLDAEQIASLKVNVDVSIKQWTDDGGEKTSAPEIAMAIGFILSFMIYIFIFIYGSQVMRGVIEEKTGRVVEIIISSVKPFELMMGKILGIALVALTQFTLWIVLTLILTTVVQSIFMPDVSSMGDVSAISQNIDTAQVTSALQNNKYLVALFDMPFGAIFFAFVFYFIGGYLLYAAFFAAIGSAVDNESDTQQFMLPVTLPLILSIVLVQFILQQPDGTIAFWLSIIPLTSPIIMVIRIPFGGVPVWELILSMSLLVATFIGATWVAAKIYRTGILMYGKKASYREIFRWLRY